MYQSQPQQYHPQLQQTSSATLMAPASLGEIIAAVVWVAMVVAVFAIFSKMTKHLDGKD